MKMKLLTNFSLLLMLSISATGCSLKSGDQRITEYENSILSSNSSPPVYVGLSMQWATDIVVKMDVNNPHNKPLKCSHYVDVYSPATGMELATHW